MQRVKRIDRTATASWEGTSARGRGEISAPSAALAAVPFSLPGRVGEVTSSETSPEELLAAAHAACFAMALASRITSRHAVSERIVVTATTSLDVVDGLNRIVASALVVDVDAPELELTEADAALVEADHRCPFSALLRDAGAAVTVKLASDAVA